MRRRTKMRTGSQKVWTLLWACKGRVSAVGTAATCPGNQNLPDGRNRQTFSDSLARHIAQELSHRVANTVTLPDAFSASRLFSRSERFERPKDRQHRDHCTELDRGSL
jgi:hypothetical protein